jgi:hypothetical protein
LSVGHIESSSYLLDKYDPGIAHSRFNSASKIALLSADCNVLDT